MDAFVMLKILSDENRLRIINILKERSLCVGEIQTILNIKQSNASRHLDKLKSNGLIVSEKKAQWIYYKINDVQLERYPFIKQLLFEDIRSISIFKEDMLRLKKYDSSGLCCQDLKDVEHDFNKISFKN